MRIPGLRRLDCEGQVLRLAALMLLVLSFPVVVLALATATTLVRLPYELALLDQRLPILFRAHMVSAGLALLLVPGAIACHGSSVHRVVGRSAAAVVLIGGITALPVAIASDAPWLAGAGFAVQAAVWVGLVAVAVHAIRRGNRQRHMWLMLAVAAVTSAALWLRLASYIAVRLHLPFDMVYALAAWLSWLVPLAAVAILAPAGTRGEAARLQFPPQYDRLGTATGPARATTGRRCRCQPPHADTGWRCSPRTGRTRPMSVRVSALIAWRRAWAAR
jgi:hypothetical protein